MTRPARRLPVASAVLTALILSSCSSADNDSVGDNGGGGDEQAGGTLDFAIVVNPGCIDMHQVTLFDTMYVTRQVVESLTYEDPDTGEIVPHLAESWDINENATEFTFKLRQDVTFSDGTPFNAEVAAANLDELHAMGALASRASTYLRSYAGSEIVDEFTVRFTFDDPNAAFLSNVASLNLGMVSLATLELDPEDRCQGQIVGTGPFVLDNYTQDVEVNLTKREGYDWPAESHEHTGEALLDGINFLITPESGVRIGALSSGQVGGIMGVQVQDEALVEASGGQVLSRVNPGTTMLLGVNTQSSVMSEENVRLAVQHGIDRDTIVQTALSSHFSPSTSVLAPNVPGWVDNSELIVHDVEESARLLDEAGWELGSDGVRYRDGQPLEIEIVYMSVNNFNQSTMELAQEQLGRIGFDVTLREVLGAQWTEARSAYDWDLFLVNNTDADAIAIGALFWPHLVNLANLEPGDELDQLLDQQMAQADPAERQETFEQIQELMLTRGYAIPVFDLVQVIGVSGDLHGVTFDSGSRAVFYGASLS